MYVIQIIRTALVHINKCERETAKKIISKLLLSLAIHDSETLVCSLM